MARRFSELALAGFSGGLNTELDATSLELDELAEALNVRIGNKGEVERRTGYRRFDQGLDAPVHFLHRWRTKDGEDQILVVDEQGDLEVQSGSNPTAFAHKGNVGAASIGDEIKFPVTFTTAEDELYIGTLRHGKLRKWNGTRLADVTGVYKPTDKDDDNVYREAPAGQHVVYRHGRLHIGNTQASPSRIWFSKFLLPEAIREAAWVDLDPEDGSSIRAMIPYRDDLAVLKDNSLWVLTGRDPTTYALRTVDTLRGTVAVRSVCQMRGMLVFFDRDSGLWAYDGSSLSLLSEKINKYLLGGIDYPECNRAAAYFGDDRLYLSVPWEGDTTRTFVMNADNGAWSEYDSGFSVGDFHSQQRLQGYEGRDGLYVADPSIDTIDGTDYVSKFRTPWLNPSGAGTRSRLRRLEVVVDAVPSSLNTFIIELYRELDHMDPYRTRLFHTDPFPFDARVQDERAMHSVALDGWGGRLHHMQLAVTMQNSPAQLNRMDLLVSTTLDERGERRA